LLKKWGVESRLRAVAEPEKDATFLCFGRGDPRDIVIDGQKIVGSAQRRRKGAVLQHGSLLLRRSPHAQQFDGVFDIVPELVLTANAEAQLAADIGNALGKIRPDFVPKGSVLERAKALEASRYRTSEWSKELP
jgi:lipoate-protein ligase A